MRDEAAKAGSAVLLLLFLIVIWKIFLIYGILIQYRKSIITLIVPLYTEGMVFLILKDIKWIEKRRKVCLKCL